ncbi:MAG: hypothetical protein J3Q66DRAFT_353106, partial [Benniella sp.]
MPQFRSLSIFTFFTITLTFLFCALSTPSTLAQKFRPLPDYDKCSAFVEGQAFYLLGGEKQENFILDLSVSWNTSDPAYKKLEGGPPKVDRRSCAMTNNGEDLFVMSAGVGYIYNVKSNSWKPFPNANFAVNTQSKSGYFAVTDPETGIIYLPDGGVDFTGKVLMLSVDIRTGTVNTTASNPYIGSQAVWNTHLKGMVIASSEDHGLMTFTPSKVTTSSDGWSLLNTTPQEDWSWDCGASAYGDSIMVFIGGTRYTHQTLSYIYIFDVAKQTWKKGPLATNVFFSSCAVSGDQFIVWGGYFVTVFNMKTNKWVSRYIPPRPRPTTTTLRPSPTPNGTLVSGNTSSSDTKLVIIIAAVTGTLLAAILGLIFRYHRRTRLPNPNESSTGLLDIKDSVKIPRPGLVGRLHEGVFGANQVSEQPHAIVEDPTTKRNVQEGALEVQIPPQYPHTMVGRQEPAFQTAPQHPHTMVNRHELALQIPLQ